MQQRIVLYLKDIYRDIGIGFRMTGTIALPNAFHLEIQQEVLGRRIAARISLAIRTAHETALDHQRLVPTAAYCLLRSERTINSGGSSPPAGRPRIAQYACLASSSIPPTLR
jgi:hypothetical protein